MFCLHEKYLGSFRYADDDRNAPRSVISDVTHRPSVPNQSYSRGRGRDNRFFIDRDRRNSLSASRGSPPPPLPPVSRENYRDQPQRENYRDQPQRENYRAPSVRENYRDQPYRENFRDQHDHRGERVPNITPPPRPPSSRRLDEGSPRRNDFRAPRELPPPRERERRSRERSSSKRHSERDSGSAPTRESSRSRRSIGHEHQNDRKSGDRGRNEGSQMRFAAPKQPSPPKDMPEHIRWLHDRWTKYDHSMFEESFGKGAVEKLLKPQETKPSREPRAPSSRRSVSRHRSRSRSPRIREADRRKTARPTPRRSSPPRRFREDGPDWDRKYARPYHDYKGFTRGAMDSAKMMTFKEFLMSLPGEIEDHKKAMEQYNDYKVKICFT